MSYIVTCTYKGKERDVVTFWYGPDHSWGTTSGSRDHAATFPHRVAAEDALRSVFGSVAAAHRRGYQARAARFFPELVR
jgi:hypothetical protein